MNCFKSKKIREQKWHGRDATTAYHIQKMSQVRWSTIEVSLREQTIEFLYTGDGWVVFTYTT